MNTEAINDRGAQAANAQRRNSTTKRSDLELLRAVVDIEGLQAVNRQDYHLAAEVTARLLATVPQPKPFVPSGKAPEETSEIVKRLPRPMRKKGYINNDGSRES